MVVIGDETLQRQPLWVRLLFGLAVIAVIPAITLGGLWIIGQFRDDSTATAVAPVVTASPTADAAVDATASPTVEGSPNPTTPPSPSPTPPPPSPSPTPPPPSPSPTPPPPSPPPTSPSPLPKSSPSPPPSSPTALTPLVPYSGTPPTTDAEVRAIYDQMVTAASDIGRTPDPLEIDALYATQCRCYQPFRDDIAGNMERGEYGVGENPEVLSFEVRRLGSDPDPQWTVRALVQIDTDGKTYNRAGEVVADGADAQPEDLVVSAVARDGGWFYTQVDRIEE